MNKEEYDDGNNKDNKSAEGNYDNNSIDNESESAAANTTGKDIKKGMDKYEAKIKSGEASIGDSTRSEE
jgi:hypothetical protein